MTVRLLIVDDHPVVRAGMVAMLSEEAGLEIVGEAANGAEALGLIPRLRPDVVLMDLRMPVMDGCTAARIIRASAHPDARTVPILAMSADAYDSDVEKTLRAGMNGHIAKPVDQDKMLLMIAENINNR